MSRYGCTLSGIILGLIWGLLVRYTFYHADSTLGLVFIPLTLATAIFLGVAIAEDTKP